MNTYTAEIHDPINKVSRHTSTTCRTAQEAHKELLKGTRSHEEIITMISVNQKRESRKVYDHHHGFME